MQLIQKINSKSLIHTLLFRSNLNSISYFISSKIMVLKIRQKYSLCKFERYNIAFHWEKKRIKLNWPKFSPYVKPPQNYTTFDKERSYNTFDITEILLPET